MDAGRFRPMDSVRVEILPPVALPEDDMGDSGDTSIAIDDVWDRLRRARPRLFDGPILSFVGEDRGVVLARRDSYKRLAVQGEARHLVTPPVVQLSVTGVLVAYDDAGTPHIFLGKRSDDTRIYGSLWELGPSGGLDPPAPGVHALDEHAVIRQLQVECRDEVGIAGVFTSHAVLGLIDDPVAMSTDIVVRLDLQRRLGELLVSASNWEYAEARWLPAAELAAFGEREPTIPPTAALLPVVAAMLAG